MSYEAPPPPAPPPPGVPGVPPGQPYGAPPPNSGKAVTALVLGILGIVMCQVLGVAAVIVGKQANDEIAASGGRLGGEGLAKAGIILGWVAVALLVVTAVILFFVLLLAAVANT
jgi:Domain of unknown function (DUF4190)